MQTEAKPPPAVSSSLIGGLISVVETLLTVPLTVTDHMDGGRVYELENLT